LVGASPSPRLSLSQAIGCIARDFEEARSFLMPLLAPQLIFSGYLLPLKQIPAYFSWLYYASFWQYALGILQINEFRGRVYTEECPTTELEQTAYNDVRAWLQTNYNTTLPPKTFHGNCSADASLTAAGLLPVQFGGLSGYFGIMLGYLLLFTLLAYLLLKASLRKASTS